MPKKSQKRNQSPTLEEKYATSKVLRTLQDFGLSENEATVYVTALNYEETSPYQLAKDTKIPRTTVYDVLLGLSLKGLVQMEKSDGMQKQQTKIGAVNPSVLRSILRQRHKELDQIEVDVVDILTTLKSNFHANTHSSDFQYFPGTEGAQHVLFSEDAGEIDEPMYAFENLMPMDAFGREAVNKAVNDATSFRVNSKSKIYELVPLTSWAKHVLSYQIGRDENYLVARNIRYIENPIFDQKLRIVIKGNRIKISCAEGDEAWGIVIKSKALAASMQSIFQVLWMQAVPVTLDLVKSWGTNAFLEAEKRKENGSLGK